MSAPSIPRGQPEILVSTLLETIILAAFSLLFREKVAYQIELFHYLIFEAFRVVGPKPFVRSARDRDETDFSSFGSAKISPCRW
jgi:hypothetical protein